MSTGMPAGTLAPRWPQRMGMSSGLLTGAVERNLLKLQRMIDTAEVSMQINLSSEECTLLIEVLDGRARELRVEIRHTDLRAAKELLKRNLELLEMIMTKCGAEERHRAGEKVDESEEYSFCAGL